jgi:hypothetical protein
MRCSNSIHQPQPRDFGGSRVNVLALNLGCARYPK